MNVSAILVVVPADTLDAATAALNALPGVQVHHTDPPTGRMIVTQEAESVGAEVEGLRRIQVLPDVTMAEMVQHCFEEDEQIIRNLPEEEIPRTMPSFLEDGSTLPQPSNARRK